MQPEATPGRRSVVTAAVLGAGGVAGLTACDSSTGAGTSSTTVTGTPAGPTTPAEDQTAGSSTGAAAGGLVPLSQVPVRGSVAVQGPAGPIVVAQPAAGTVVAFSAVCTHQGCRVQPQGARLDCPCHGSVFDAFTGQVVNGPAQAPLPAVPVKISGQDVVAG